MFLPFRRNILRPKYGQALVKSADNINKATSKLPADIYTFLNYEQLDDKPTEVERTVINLIPELYDFRVLGFKNGNAKHHLNLKKNQSRKKKSQASLGRERT